MISAENFEKLSKKVKKFKGNRVYIEFVGIVDTKIIIDNARVILNQHKLIIGNSENDFTMQFLLVKKVKFDVLDYIEFQYADFKVILAV